MTNHHSVSPASAFAQHSDNDFPLVQYPGEEYSYRADFSLRESKCNDAAYTCCRCGENTGEANTPAKPSKRLSYAERRLQRHL